MEIKTHTKWFDRKFKFSLQNDEYKSVLSRLKNTPTRIKKIVNDLSTDVLTKKINEKWSIQEHIGHLIVLEELHSSRIDDFINGEKVLHPADLKNKKTNESDFNKKRLTDVLSELEIVRKNFVKRLEELDEVVKNKVSTHPRLKQEMRPIDMAYFVAEHDDHHIKSIIDLKNILIRK